MLGLIANDPIFTVRPNNYADMHLLIISILKLSLKVCLVVVNYIRNVKFRGKNLLLFGCPEI